MQKPDQPLCKAQLLKPFSFVTPEGEKHSLDEFRGRFNGVLAAGEFDKPWLEQLSAIAPELEALETKAVLLLPDPYAHGVDFRKPVLLASADKPETIAILGLHQEDSQVKAVICVTDRWLEIYAVWYARAQQELPEPKELLEWLEFINIQCPECFPPEWPASN